MPPRAVPPRIHVVLARESDAGIVIARVRTQEDCTIGGTGRDRFEVGQWLRARLYPFRSDLSPDGTQFVSFVFDGRRLAQGESEAYTAVSRAPYLKALVLWPQRDTYAGGGLFLDDQTLWANGCEAQEGDMRGPSRLSVVGPPAELPWSGWEDRRVYFPRLVRDGWRQVRRCDLSPRHDVHVFEKPLPCHHVLEKAFHGTSERRREGRGCYYEEHGVLSPSGGRVEHSDWEWADLDAPRRRVIYASAGCVWAASIDQGGVGAPKLLCDTRSLRFEANSAPY